VPKCFLPFFRTRGTGCLPPVVIFFWLFMGHRRGAQRFFFIFICVCHFFCVTLQPKVAKTTKQDNKTMANTLNVQGTEITIIKVHAEDYICLTDMLKTKDGDFFVTDWLRNRNILEYIGIWEKVNNPDFNYGEFATIRNNAGLRTLKASVY
jgi:hypothetical protein